MLRVLDDTPLPDPLVQTVPRTDGGLDYPVPVTDFRVTRYDITGSASWHSEGPELVLCTRGDSGAIGRGQGALTLDGEPVQLTGDATVFRVGGR